MNSLSIMLVRASFACFVVATAVAILPVAAAVEFNPAMPNKNLAAIFDSTWSLKSGFELQASDGSNEELKDISHAKYVVLCFLATECPLSSRYAVRLNELATSFRALGVRMVGIDSNQQDSLSDIQQFCNAVKLEFPLYKDIDQNIARHLAVDRNPSICVLDRSGKICYRGRIDDQYSPGIARDKPTSFDLRNALTKLLSGNSDFTNDTQAVGCRITLPSFVAEPSQYTYCKDIQPILQSNCVECHRAGEIAPFALTDFEEIRGWSDMMLEVIDQHRMPPWHADDNVAFANARAMKQTDKEILRNWVSGGMPFGNPDDLVETKQSYSESIKVKQPDLILPMSEAGFEVPATGAVDYQYFVVDPKLVRDKWVRRADVIVGNRAVLHHAIVFIRPPDDADFRDIELLTAYVPGQMNYVLPEGHAQHIRAGSHFVFQMHYTPNGFAQTDQSALALEFIDDSLVTHQINSIAGLEQDFEIPPTTADHPVPGQIRHIPRDGKLLAVAPHMHLRGKGFELEVQRGGTLQNVLRVPHYDFNWQHNYIYQSPIELRDIESISFTAHFDNSNANPHNPDPSEFVTWGDQTWEEMAIVFLTVAQPRKYSIAESTAMASDQNKKRNALDVTQTSRDNWTTIAKERLKHFDTNHDGFVTTDEVPQSFLMFQFKATDSNRDGRLDLNELIQQASYRE